MSDIGFWNLAQQSPDKVALIDPQEQTWSRGQLLSQCNQLVHGLRSLGLEVGDSVAVVLPNCKEFYIVYLACYSAGFYLVPVNWHLTGSEVAYILKDSEAKAFITHQQVEATAIEALQSANFSPQHAFAVGNINGFNPLSDFLAAQSDAMPNNMTAGNVMYYTSGTTGRPKGVKRALIAADPNMVAAMMCGFQMMFGITPEGDGIHYCGSPLYHTAVLNWSSNAIHLGHPVILVEQWDGEDMLRLIDKYKVTNSHMVPTQFVRLLKLPQEVRDRYDVSSTRNMVHAAAPCPVDVKQAMLQWWGNALYEYYAATEGGGTIASPEEWLENPGTVGKPWFGADIKIMDDDGNELPTGEIGTVYILLSEQMRFEYKGDKEKTEKDRIGNYFTVGDVGYLNADNFLFLCDRKIDMIISGGVNIYPAEIEGALLMHPKVKDCAVFGIPNDDWGEEIKAVVELIDHNLASEALAEEFKQFLQGRIAKMKVPRSFDFTEQLPRDPNGKLYKRRLRDPYWQNHSKI